jgi:hypothetical protein
MDVIYCVILNERDVNRILVGMTQVSVLLHAYVYSGCAAIYWFIVFM